jgi:hypothetical protein
MWSPAVEKNAVLLADFIKINIDLNRDIRAPFAAGKRG